jgi:hypothetical protein
MGSVPGILSQTKTIPHQQQVIDAFKNLSADLPFSAEEITPIPVDHETYYGPVNAAPNTVLRVGMPLRMKPSVRTNLYENVTQDINFVERLVTREANFAAGISFRGDTDDPLVKKAELAMIQQMMTDMAASDVRNVISDIQQAYNINASTFVEKDILDITADFLRRGYNTKNDPWTFYAPTIIYNRLIGFNTVRSIEDNSVTEGFKKRRVSMLGNLKIIELNDFDTPTTTASGITVNLLANSGNNFVPKVSETVTTSQNSTFEVPFDCNRQTLTFSSNAGVVVGSSFSIAGVFAMNQLTRGATSTPFVAKVIAVGSGNQITFSPPIISTVGTTGTDIEAQYQNCVIPTPLSNHAVTFLNNTASVATGVILPPKRLAPSKEVMQVKGPQVLTGLMRLVPSKVRPDPNSEHYLNWQELQPLTAAGIVPGVQLFTFKSSDARNNSRSKMYYLDPGKVHLADPAAAAIIRAV